MTLPQTPPADAGRDTVPAGVNNAPVPVTVKPEPGSRLDELDVLYADAKREADAAAERLKTITDAIKYELAKAAPGASKVELHGVNQLRLQAKTQWRLDTPRLKAEAPEVYVRFAKQTTCWELRAVPNGGASS